MAFDVMGAKQAGYSDQEINQYLASQQPQNPAPQAQPHSGGFADYLPLLGGIAGSFIGSPILGGAIGAGLGTLGKQALEGGQSYNPGEVLKQAALAGAGGIGGKLIGGILGKVLPDTLGNIGEGAIASQYNVPRNVGRAINFPNSIKTLANKYGITDINKIPDIAGQVTGESGVVSQLTRRAVASANPVPLGAYADATGAMTPSVSDLAANLVANPSITSGTENKFINFIQKGLTNIGGPQGTETANPSETFGLIQQLEKQAAGITKGRSPSAITAEDQALVNAYKSVAGELEHRLFNISGGDSAVAKGIATPEELNALNAIHPQLATDVHGAQTVADLRGLAAPFVQANKAAAETNAASQFGFQNLAGAAKGLAKGVPTLGNPLAPIQAGLGTNAVNSTVGGAALKGSNFLKNLPIPSTPTLTRAGVAAGANAGNPATSLPSPVGTPDTTGNIGLGSAADQTNATAQAPARDPLRTALGMYALQHARSIGDLVSGYNLLNPKPVAGQLSTQEANLLNSQLDKFGAIYKQMGPVQRLNPYDPQNRQLQTIRTLMISQIRKAIVGGRATQYEINMITDLLPTLNHPGAVIYPSDTVDSAIDQLKTSLGTTAQAQSDIPLPSNYSGLGQ